MVSNAEQANKALQDAATLYPGDEQERDFLARAQVYATLAVADALAEVTLELQSMRHPERGTGLLVWHG